MHAAYLASMNLIEEQAGGPFGTEMADALLRAGWNVTVLARKPSAVPPRSGATVVQFSPDDHASLVRAMRGAEVVLCTVSGGNADPFTLQKPLIDAAIEAGVPRFVPSEYAADMAHPKAVASPIYESRRKVIAYLKEKAEKGEISYTIFHTGGLFEFGEPLSCTDATDSAADADRAQGS